MVKQTQDNVRRFQELKREVLERRKHLSTEEYQRFSEKARLNLQNQRFYQEARHILFYYRKESAKEVDTLLSIQEALKRSVRVSLPKTEIATNNLLTFQIHDMSTDLIEGAFGIMEPSLSLEETTFSSEIDLIIVPGSLFDVHGNRWGYGFGYYDKFLESFNTQVQKMPLLVGFAFDFQVIDGKLPTNSTDYPLDILVTDKRIIFCSQRAKQLRGTN